jgi:hypothetical protein
MIDEFEKTPEIKALELQQAKDILAQHYIDTVAALEQSHDPRAFTKDHVNALENNALLESERRLLFKHEEQRLSLHDMHQEQLKTLSANNPNLSQEGLNTVIARHKEEAEILSFEQNRQLADLNHESDKGLEAAQEKMEYLLTQNPLSLFGHRESEDLRPRFDARTDNQKTSHNLDNEADRVLANRALAKQELEAHHRCEYETIQEKHHFSVVDIMERRGNRQLSDAEYQHSYQRLNDALVRDVETLNSLHFREKELLERSDKPLENTRAVVNDVDRFADFESYVEERIKVEQHILDQEKDITPSIGDEREFEAHVRGALQERAEQLAINNALDVPGIVEEPSKNDHRFTHQHPGETISAVHAQDHTLDSGSYSAQNTTLTYDPSIEEYALPDTEFYNLDNIGHAQDYISWQSEGHDIGDVGHEL